MTAGVSPNPIATIGTGATWSGCTGVGVHYTVTQFTTWNIDDTGPTTAAGATPVAITNISAEWRDTDLGGWLCVFDVNGSVTGTFTNSSQQLAITASSLTVTVDPHSTGASCSGLILNGGSATFSGTFNVNSPSGAIVIS